MRHRRDPGQATSTAIASIGLEQMSARKSWNVTSQRESAHTSATARRIHRAPKWSNVIRHPSSLVLSCCVVRKLGDCYAMQSCFLLRVRWKHGNPIDRSFGGVFARWRGLGILSLARLARSQDRLSTLLGPYLWRL